MASGDFTLKDFFTSSGDLAEQVAEQLRTNKQLTESGNSLAERVKNIQWTALAGTVAKKLTDTLDMPLADILIKTWLGTKKDSRPEDETPEPAPAICPACHSRATTEEPSCANCGTPLVVEGGALAGELAENAESEDETKLLPLAKHTIQSDHSPSVELLRDGRSIAKVTFEVSVTMIIEGAILEIRGGAIEEIRFGEVKGQGSISCQGVPLLEKQMEPVAVPVVLRIARGEAPRRAAAGA